jgi:hypothetical protein
MTARHLIRAMATLAAIGLALTSALLVLFARTQEVIRGDFCAWTVTHNQASHELPQVPARRASERSDVQLEHKLDCP